MSGPQFVHVQTWSRKPNPAGQSVAQIIAEATRNPEYSGHVDDPLPPRVLLGDPSTFQAEHDAHVAARATVARLKDGSERVRSIRKDRHTMATVVMSYPVPRAAITTAEDRAALERWERRNIDWLRDRYGDQLRVVLAHDDEEHPHIHAWLLPDDPGADATTLHPGKVAKKRVEEEEKAAGTPPREAVKAANRALREAMTLFQDEYYHAVGAPEGLTRTGPRRRRLTRQQWKAEKAAAAATAASLERASQADELVAEIDRDRQSLDEREVKLDEREAALDRAFDEIEEVKVAQKKERQRLSDLAQSLADAQRAASAVLRELRGLMGLDRSVRKDLRSGLKELLSALQPKKPVSEHERIVADIESRIGSAPDKLGEPFEQTGPRL
jgi:hypothetical protein